LTRNSIKSGSTVSRGGEFLVEGDRRHLVATNRHALHPRHKDAGTAPSPKSCKYMCDYKLRMLAL
jgi:hypothetical protein